MIDHTGGVMLGLFEKREERKRWESIVQTKEYRKKMEETLPEEVKVQAVVGASGFGAGRAGKEKLWNASVRLTAWKEEESGKLHQENILLTTLADDALLKRLQNSVKCDSVIRCSVRIFQNGRCLLMTGPVQAGDDPGLKAILEEQVREVTMEVEGFGIFTLERTVDWFETTVDWLGVNVHLSFDRDETEAMERAIAAARLLMADQKGWDQRIREYAADELLDSANDWAESDVDDEELERLEEAGEQLVSREQFMERMDLESIQVEEDGDFDFWFGDGDLFYGHSIHVSGNVEKGLNRAVIEG